MVAAGTVLLRADAERTRGGQVTATSVIDIALPQHDIGVREVAALSARAAYVLMCFTLCWGILTATGWIRRLTGHQAIRSSHMILATFTIAAGVTHAIVFLLLREQGLNFGSASSCRSAASSATGSASSVSS